ncbi:MAG: hypothetical protein ACE5ES_02860 [Candidatus Nanoarchaeia archaeon]
MSENDFITEEELLGRLRTGISTISIGYQINSTGIGSELDKILGLDHDGDIMEGRCCGPDAWELYYELCVYRDSLDNGTNQRGALNTLNDILERYNSPKGIFVN